MINYIFLSSWFVFQCLVNNMVLLPTFKNSQSGVARSMQVSDNPKVHREPVQNRLLPSDFYTLPQSWA